jgi:hypothetical protein
MGKIKYDTINISKWLFALIILSILYSCKTSNKGKISALAPKEFYNKAEIDPEISHINMLTGIPVAALEKRANDNIPELLYEDNNIDDDGYSIKVWRKGGLKIIPQKGMIEFRLPLKIHAKAKIDLGFLKHEQEADFELTPSYVTRISISPDWKIISKTTSNGYQWVTKPTVKIGPMEIDIAPFIEKILDKQQDKIGAEIDNIVAANVSIKSYVESAWQLIQTPIPLADKYNAWLKISPKEVFFIPIHGDTSVLKAGVAIKGMTNTFIGEKPGVVYTPVPDISVYDEPDNSFKINLLARISFATASAIAKENIKRQKLNLNDGKNKFKIDDIEIYGSGEKLIVKATVSGDVNGVIYLSGNPYYDSSTTSISVKGLDFELETKNQLLKTADWLAHGVFIKKIEKALTFPIKSQTEEAKAYLQKFITDNKINNYVTINGNIESISAQKMLIIDNYILLQIAARGIINMSLSGF